MDIIRLGFSAPHPWSVAQASPASRAATRFSDRNPPLHSNVIWSLLKSVCP